MGPTASGKSALALKLARLLAGEIVNADAQQVYRQWRALSNRPTPEEEARAPHHLFGNVDVWAPYSVGKWLAELAPVLSQIRARERVPILVGGTGLYFKAVTEGLAHIPPPDPEIRAGLRARARIEDPQILHAELAALDPAAAALLPVHDRVRVIRALEVALSTGRKLGEFQAQAAFALLPRAQCLAIALAPPRERLYAAIDHRLPLLVAAGGLEEARAIATLDLAADLPALKAHGAPALFAHLRNDLRLDEALALGCRDTRHYAKRQLTWMRRFCADWLTIAEEDLDQRVAIVRRHWDAKKGTPSS